MMCSSFPCVDRLRARRSVCEVHLKEIGHLRHASGWVSSCESSDSLKLWRLTKSGIILQKKKSSKRQEKPILGFISADQRNFYSFTEARVCSVSVKGKIWEFGCGCLSLVAGALLFCHWPTSVQHEPKVPHKCPFTPVFCHPHICNL